MRRQWKLGLDVILIAGTLALLPGCSQAPSRDASEAAVVDEVDPMGVTYPVDGLAIDGDELTWAGIRIGMPRAEIERRIGESLEPLEANEICESFVITRPVGRTRVTFEFPDESATAPLEHVFIPLDGTLPQSEQILRLKRQLPGSTYVPSRYAPDLAEPDNPKPVYRVATAKPRVVMLNTDEGLWLGDPRCYD